MSTEWVLDQLLVQCPKEAEDVPKHILWVDEMVTKKRMDVPEAVKTALATMVEHAKSVVVTPGTNLD